MATTSDVELDLGGEPYTTTISGSSSDSEFQFDFDSLPTELQAMIVQTCATLAASGCSCLHHQDQFGPLYSLSLTNRTLYAMASPALWRSINFAEDNPREATMEAQRQFFAACDTLIKEQPKRWSTLATRVKSLQLARGEGPYISHKSTHEREDEGWRDAYAILGSYD